MHKAYINIAKAASELSKDSTKIGAIALDSDSRIVGVGVNGYPPGYDDLDLNHKYAKVVHAEMNAIINSKTHRDDVYSIYVYGLPPCEECMKFMVAYGVKKVFYTVDDDITSLDAWKFKHHKAKNLHDIIIEEIR